MGNASHALIWEARPAGPGAPIREQGPFACGCSVDRVGWAPVLPSPFPMRAGGKREPRATRTGTSTPLRCDMWQVWTLQAQAPPTLERWAPAPGARQCLRNSRGAQWGLRAQQAEGLWSGMFWNLRGRHATPSLSERKSQLSWVQTCPQGLLRQGSSAPHPALPRQNRGPHAGPHPRSSECFCPDGIPHASLWPQP